MDLEEKVDYFLKDFSKQVLLIFGKAGAGKSLFTFLIFIKYVN